MAAIRACCPSLLLLGVAASLFFGQISRTILGSVPARYGGIASGTGTTFRQLGTTLGVAVLGATFAAAGGYRNAATFSRGFRVALWVGAAAAVLAALLALTLRQANKAESLRCPDKAAAAATPGRLPGGRREWSG